MIYDVLNDGETPEQRVERWKKTEWTLVHLQGYRLDSDQQIETYIKMSGDILGVVAFYFEHNGWDPLRSRIVSEEFIGVVH